ncbi:hypothetical protein [Stenotrophomonas phage StM171]|nr:hypothetical protein [Stenotrophomonas phage StM171]
MTTQASILFPDQAEANAYWATRASKKWAVVVQAGSGRVPTFRVLVLVQASSEEAAKRSGLANLHCPVPRNARVTARLATAQDLGCRPLQVKP